MGKLYKLNNRHSSIFVIKANGRRTRFNRNKVVSTCMRAGASRKLAYEISNTVLSKIRDGMTTKQIYRLVLSLLQSLERNGTTRYVYRLKESIMNLGPSGFFFEDYMGRIFAENGYNVDDVRKFVQGKCITHEIDLIVTEKDANKKFLVECKYHNLPGVFTGLKESLYTHARYLDLSERFDGEILICNTKVSDDVITYSKCIGQKVISWRYPPEKSLEQMIEKNRLYPITILPLRKTESSAFADNKILLVSDMTNMKSEELSSKTGIPINRIQAIQRIASHIIKKSGNDSFSGL